MFSQPLVLENAELQDFNLALFFVTILIQDWLRKIKWLESDDEFYLPLCPVSRFPRVVDKHLPPDITNISGPQIAYQKIIRGAALGDEASHSTNGAPRHTKPILHTFKFM